MAQYFEDFESDTLGAAPAGFTLQGATADFKVISEASQKSVSRDTNNTNYGYCIYDAITSETNAQILAKFKNDAGGAGGSTINLWVALSGSAGSEDGYSVNVDRGFADMRVQRWDAGATTVIGSNSSRSISDGVTYWLRFEKTGTTIRAKMWVDGTSEPETWDVSVTDATHSSGSVAFGVSNNDRDLYFKEVGFGSGGDSAPDAPVAGSTTVNVGTKTFTLTENAASIVFDRDVAVATASFTLTANAATIGFVANNDVNISVGTASFTLSPLAASIALDRNIAVQTETLTLTPNQASIALGNNIFVGTATLSLTPNSASIAYDRNVDVQSATFSLTTNRATIDGGAQRQVIAIIGVPISNIKTIF